MAPRTRTKEHTIHKEAENDVAVSHGAWFDRLQAGIAIDKLALDECLIEQPQLFFEVSERLALLMSQRDAAKDNLKVVEAEIDDIIRGDAAQEDKKITETAVKKQIEAHRDVIAANKKLRDLNQQVAHIGALKEAYSQRSYMLREVVALHLAGYYDTATAGTRKTTQEDIDQTRKRINDERQRRKTKQN